MVKSKLTSKAQTTIPQPVRTALGIKEGDEIAYQIEDGRVILTKVPVSLRRAGIPFEDPFAMFSEWETPEDEAAFANF